MTVQINQPRPRENPLDTVVKGLQVVGGVLNIKNTLAEAERDKARFEAEQQSQAEAKQGLFTPGDIQKGILSGAVIPAQKGMAGAIPLRVRSSGPADQSGLLPSQEEYVLPSAVVKRQAEERQQQLAETDRVNKAKIDAVQDFEKKPQVKDSTDAFSRSKLVDDLLAQNSPQTDQIALRQLFRLSGDVGAIRDSDIDALGRDRSVWQRAKGTLLELSEGAALTPEARERVRQGLKIMQDHHRAILSKQAESFSKSRAADIRGVNSEDLFRSINIDSLLDQSFSVQGGSQQMLSQPSAPTTFQTVRDAVGGMIDPSSPAQANQGFNVDAYIRGK